jgi:hypothetical protein
MLLSILKKMTYLTNFYSANVNFQQLYVFAMNSKASPPSTNLTKKCRALVPYIPCLESRSVGEHTVQSPKVRLWYVQHHRNFVARS